MGRNVEDRAAAAALGAAYVGVARLPQNITAVRPKPLSKLPAPTLPARAAPGAGRGLTHRTLSHHPNSLATWPPTPSPTSSPMS